MVLSVLNACPWHGKTRLTTLPGLHFAKTPTSQHRTHKWIRQPAQQPLRRMHQHKTNAIGDASIANNELMDLSHDIEQTGSKPASNEGHRVNSVNGVQFLSWILSIWSKVIARIDTSLLGAKSFCTELFARIEDVRPTKEEVVGFMKEGVTTLKALTLPSPKEIAWKSAMVFVGTALLMITVNTLDSGYAALLAKIPKRTV